MIVALIIAVIMLVVAFLMMPKPKAAAGQKINSPTVQDGQSVKHHFGTCWVDDTFLLAWKVTGKSAIKGGGKK